MASICAFGRYLPERVLGNEELAGRLGCEANWILQASGIEERRIAARDETVEDMGVAAARGCLAELEADVGMVIVSSGSAGARFPGPAAEIAQRLGFAGIPAIDLPLASAGSLFGVVLASQLVGVYGNVLVIASEKMSSTATEPPDKNVAILFGDGAGACLVSPSGEEAHDGEASDRSGSLREKAENRLLTGAAQKQPLIRGNSLFPQPAGAASRELEIVGSVLHSDGTWSQDLRLEWGQPLRMNGPAVIMQAARKIPSAIQELLVRHGVAASGIGTFVMHQANQNLIDRVARAVGVAGERFYSNIRRYGNTSSASMLIAASEWYDHAAPVEGDLVCFAGFGAGFHWGALLARKTALSRQK